MSDRKEFRTMNCVQCGRTLPYPEMFPNPAMADCWRCCWDRHIRDQHPRTVRRIRREATKRARRIKRAELQREFTERERQLLGIEVEKQVTQ
jgi:hypothetical protein